MTLFPYFGGKAGAAAAVWRHLGAPDLYIEPFGGSLAVLLNRPSEPKVEIAVDLDGLLLNFWRAIRGNWAAVAAHLGGPVSEVDIYAKHKALLEVRPKLTERLADDAWYFDSRYAAWWWQGVSSWIGSGYGYKLARQRPHIDRSLKGAWATRMTDERIAAVAARLSNVVLLSGDWTEAWNRAATPAIVKRWSGPSVGVFLDPPYVTTERQKGLYAEDKPLNKAVTEWCLNERLGAKVVVAGYRSEYPALEEAGWEIMRWNQPNGYAGNANKRRAEDVLFLSPVQLTRVLRRRRH